jgi:hypothetical protein
MKTYNPIMLSEFMLPLKREILVSKEDDAPLIHDVSVSHQPLLSSYKG